jgi:hypothetical protein
VAAGAKIRLSVVANKSSLGCAGIAVYIYGIFCHQPFNTFK